MVEAEHSELIQVLKRDRAVEKAKAERHGQLAQQMDKLIALLEAGATPSDDLFGQISHRNGSSTIPPVAATETPRAFAPPAEAPRTFGAPVRKFERQPQYEKLSTAEAIRSILAERGPTHADDLAREIFKTNAFNFQKIKSTVVSEAVRGMKNGDLRRVGENIFALSEEKKD
jgi:hypothetical protein